MIQQDSKKGVWINEAGQSIPIKYITPLDKLKEKSAVKIFTKAMKLNQSMSDFKKEWEQISNEVWDASIEELKANPNTKGNFTYYSFSRDIKVEASVNEHITFDDIGIAAAKNKLDEFLLQSVSAKDEFVTELITNAFSTTKGKLDVKKVMELMRYRSKVKNPLFQESIELLEKSIRRPSSKKYQRVYYRQPDGSYKAIDLNFSSIN